MEFFAPLLLRPPKSASSWRLRNLSMQLCNISSQQLSRSRISQAREIVKISSVCSCLKGKILPNIALLALMPWLCLPQTKYLEQMSVYASNQLWQPQQRGGIIVLLQLCTAWIVQHFIGAIMAHFFPMHSNVNQPSKLGLLIVTSQTFTVTSFLELCTAVQGS